MASGVTIIEQARVADAAPSVWALRWRVMRVIAARELREAMVGWALYVTAALSVLVSVLLVYNTLSSLAASGLLVLNRPFMLPASLALDLALLYLTAWATLAIARPRDQGALRVLFFAPVDALSLVGGHALAGLAIYGLLLALILPLLFALALLTNLPLPPLLALGLLCSPAFAAPALALGLLLSALAASSRSAMFVLGAALLLLLALPLGYSALLAAPATSRYYDALLFLRALLGFLRDALGWLSPFALLDAGLDAARRASWGELTLRMAAALVGAALWLALAVWGLQRRGVLA